MAATLAVGATISGQFRGVTRPANDAQQARIAAALRDRYPAASTDLGAFITWGREKLNELEAIVLEYERAAAAKAAADAVQPLALQDA